MSYTKEKLLARLQELRIDFSQYEHPVVLTVEAQAKYVGHMKGALSKNLFLKDKKHRFYIVSALVDTKVDLKVLSQRLGLGKGGLRMAPEEALGEMLQMRAPGGAVFCIFFEVPLGCVTPFALVNDSARHVCLLLDQGFKSQECCFFHPLSNDMSVAINSRDLDKFLNSIGKTPAYVDLEANPPVGKDQPPDLAGLVPSDAVILPDPPKEAASSQGPEKNHISMNNKPVATVAKAAKSSNASQKEKSDSAVNLSSSFVDPEKLVEEILEKTTSIVLSEVKEENMEKYREQLGTVVSNNIRKQLSVELKSILSMFKNTSYTEGFYAGTQYQPKRI